MRSFKAAVSSAVRSDERMREDSGLVATLQEDINESRFDDAKIEMVIRTRNF